MKPENRPLEPLKFLEELRALKFLSTEEEQRIKESLTFITFKKGHVIDSRQKLLYNRFYIVKGTARIYYLENEKERNYAFAFDNQFITLPYSIMMKDLSLIHI